MSFSTLLLIAVAIVLGLKIWANLTAMKPTEAARLIEAGEAVLIDVREPAEWSRGVAQPALLHAMSDLRGSRQHWNPTLEQHRGKMILLYCASGMRSGAAARQLRTEGHDAHNIGGFSRWGRSGLPTRQPAAN